MMFLFSQPASLASYYYSCMLEPQFARLRKHYLTLSVSVSICLDLSLSGSEHALPVGKCQPDLAREKDVFVFARQQKHISADNAAFTTPRSSSSRYTMAVGVIAIITHHHQRAIIIVVREYQWQPSQPPPLSPALAGINSSNSRKINKQRQ